MILSYPSAIGSNNVIFGSDGARAYQDLSVFDANHYRVKVHPLILILTQPTVLIINGITNYPPLSLVLLGATCGSAIVALFFKTLQMLNIASPIRTLFSLILGFSFTLLIFSNTPETFIYAGFWLSAFWCYATYLSRKNEPLTLWNITLLVFFGITCFGITLTNYLCYLIGIIFLLAYRKDIVSKLKLFLAINLLCLVGIVFLSALQSFLWPQCPPFWNSLFDSALNGAEYEETRYMSFALSLDKTVLWFKEAIIYPLIAGPLVINTWASGQRVIWFGQDITFPILIGLALFVVITVAACMYLVQMIRKHREKEAADKRCRNLMFLFAGIAWLQQILLHYFYGYSEAFMYAPHFLFLFLITGAICCNHSYNANTRCGKIVIIVMSIFLITQMMVNLASSFETAVLATVIFERPYSLKKAVFVSLVVLFIALIANWRIRKNVNASIPSDVLIKKGLFAFFTLTFLVCICLFVNF